MSRLYQHISVSQNSGVMVLTIEPPQLSQYELVETVGKELRAAFQQSEASAVVVDLHNVRYVSSVGYGPLISLRSRVREAGGRLILCGLSEDLQEAFEKTRLLINPQSPKSLFEYANSLEDALEALKQPS